ncbi:MAG: DUF4242 domain-containing protein [Dehalococcoidia bacterium]
MPLYMDTHKNVPGLTAEAVAGAHQRDIEVQGKHGVKYLRYWFNEAEGTVYCLVEAPSKAAAETVHREAHGLVAQEITEVKEGS